MLRSLVGSEMCIRDRLQDVFRLLDMDGSGSVGIQEMLLLGRAVRGDEFSEEKAKRRLGKLDTSGDGVIDMSEFVQFYTEGKMGMADEHVWAAEMKLLSGAAARIAAEQEAAKVAAAKEEAARIAAEEEAAKIAAEQEAARVAAEEEAAAKIAADDEAARVEAVRIAAEEAAAAKIAAEEEEAMRVQKAVRAKREAELQDVFRLLDMDGSGSVGIQEMLLLGRAVRGDEFSEEKAKRRLGKLDTSGDGVIDMSEFVQFYTEGKMGMADEHVWAAEMKLLSGAAARVAAEQETAKMAARLSALEEEAASMSPRAAVVVEQASKIAAEERAGCNPPASATPGWVVLEEEVAEDAAKTASQGDVARVVEQPEQSSNGGLGTRVAELEEVFQLLDIDGSGSIGIQEMLLLGKEAKGDEFSEDKAKRRLGKLDTSGDGLVDMSEFVQFYMESTMGKAKDRKWAVEMRMLPVSYTHLTLPTKRIV
eukprot:TRINITY_DN6549_c0_g2_i1.p1 TRINITY_DN6549_c0_g2~~TRINITY_DN6549_c0_g2_i1.p1  ORF type:complete len:518 (-),score=269.61 TRINITY_DN6549_c0_g2_i1:127-1563(-)